MSVRVGKLGGMILRDPALNFISNNFGLPRLKVMFHISVYLPNTLHAEEQIEFTPDCR